MSAERNPNAVTWNLLALRDIVNRLDESLEGTRRETNAAKLLMSLAPCPVPADALERARRVCADRADS